LDYAIPTYFPNFTVDLFVSGPNEGWNLGAFLYTLSGTIGASYAAVERGYPAIAFSAGNSTHRSFTAVPANSTTDVAILNANVATNLVNVIANNAGSTRPVLPLAYGLSVNIPVLNSTCSAPKYINTRLTGGADVDSALYNSTTGLFTFGNDVSSGLNTCINGDCTLPGETNVVLGCSVAVSVYTVDYDAPSCNGAANVRSVLSPLVGPLNSTAIISSVPLSTSTSTSTSTTATTVTSTTTASGTGVIVGGGSGSGTTASTGTTTTTAVTSSGTDVGAGSGTSSTSSGTGSATSSAAAQATTNAAIHNVGINGLLGAGSVAMALALLV